MNEWNEPSCRTDLAPMPTQVQHKSTKTLNFLDEIGLVRTNPSSLSDLSVIQ